MKLHIKMIAVAAVMLFAAGLFAAPVAQRITVPQGTPVDLIFDQGLDSKTTKVGQAVRLHVRDDVMVGNRTIIRSGAPVTGVITNVKKRQRYGVNAQMMIALNPVRSAYGQGIPLSPRTKGNRIGGRKSGQAAGATAGGAIVLGPVGLLGGYFVHGKRVVIHPGDPLATEVSSTVVLRERAR